VSHLGIITSPTGAAIHDILTVLERRCPGIAVSLMPVAVQGEAAAGQISAAIERANRWQGEGKIRLDALIVGRGGGSLEDLRAFNTETVARAIAASDLPIVSAVGHEIDFSIADLVADHRAPTPSAAAELLSPDQREWLARLAGMENILLRQIQGRLSLATNELGHLRRRLKHPGYLLREQAQRLDELEQRLIFAQSAAHRQRLGELALLTSRLQSQSPRHRLAKMQGECEHLGYRLEEAMRHKWESARLRFTHLAQLLDSLSPLRTLERGYSIISDANGAVVTQASSVSAGDNLSARLATGRIKLKVVETLPESEG
jgi:exodeoxyribonuclease VII large subunit